MKIRDKGQALTIFIESAIEHTKGSQNGDYKIANKNFIKVTKSAKYLRDNDALNELDQLLEHEEKGVQLWALTYLLSTSECLAKQKLIEIRDSNLTHYSFDAKMILQEWESGNLELQFK